MAYPPSKYSPEYYKPQKPENHSCCGGGCQHPTVEVKVIQKRGCMIRYHANGSSKYNAVGGVISYKTC